MFTIGEFSQLAQVSKRLLRYYDEIGLLKPTRIDATTQRRYYSADQLPRLNRILALKDLGLSLDQIQRMLNDQVSTAEMQGMLLLKKAEIEQQLQAELKRIRNIEARLQAIRHTEANHPLDVVVKQMPAQPVLSVRTVVASLDAGLAICDRVMAALPDKNPYGLFFAILHSDGIEDGQLDVEIGRMMTATKHKPVSLGEDLQLCWRELPPVATMATYVVRGWEESILTGYSAIATWAETQGYRLAGAPREIALHLAPTDARADSIAEIQFPVEPVRPT
jgi:DNA-binding transcriptional MerR regulator/effector-binding domain-containing protein